MRRTKLIFLISFLSVLLFMGCGGVGRVTSPIEDDVLLTTRQAEGYSSRRWSKTLDNEKLLFAINDHNYLVVDPSNLEVEDVIYFPYIPKYAGVPVYCTNDRCFMADYSSNFALIDRASGNIVKEFSISRSSGERVRRFYLDFNERYLVIGFNDYDLSASVLIFDANSLSLINSFYVEGFSGGYYRRRVAIRDLALKEDEVFLLLEGSEDFQTQQGERVGLAIVALRIPNGEFLADESFAFNEGENLSWNRCQSGAFMDFDEYNNRLIAICAKNSRDPILLMLLDIDESEAKTFWYDVHRLFSLIDISEGEIKAINHRYLILNSNHNSADLDSYIIDTTSGRIVRALVNSFPLNGYLFTYTFSSGGTLHLIKAKADGTVEGCQNEAERIDELVGVTPYTERTVPAYRLERIRVTAFSPRILNTSELDYDDSRYEAVTGGIVCPR